MFKLIVSVSTVLILCYLVGSFPTSIIVGNLFKGIDIRKYGSGNAGATNTFRVLGWKAGLIVCTVDIFKGFAAAFWISKLLVFPVPNSLSIFIPVIAGTAAVLGHCYTIFGNFRGGKGVAATAGILIALFPQVFFVCMGVFFLVLVLSGYVSLSSLATAVIFPVTLYIYQMKLFNMVSVPLIIFALIIEAFIFYSHRANIKRLIAGTESRFNSIWLFAKK